jgi:hypothetical protein
MPNKSADDHKRIEAADLYFEVAGRSDGSQWRRQAVSPNFHPSAEGLNLMVRQA